MVPTKMQAVLTDNVWPQWANTYGRGQLKLINKIIDIFDKIFRKLRKKQLRFHFKCLFVWQKNTLPKQ